MKPIADQLEAHAQRVGPVQWESFKAQYGLNSGRNVERMLAEANRVLGGNSSSPTAEAQQRESGHAPGAGNSLDKLRAATERAIAGRTGKTAPLCGRGRSTFSVLSRGAATTKDKSVNAEFRALQARRRQARETANRISN